MPKFITGYKIDLSKINKRYNLNPETCPDGIVIVILNKLPSDGYIRLGLGKDEEGTISQDGHHHLILVTNEGDDKARLE